MVKTSLHNTETSRQIAVDWLMGRINYERTADMPYTERQLKLDRMRTLLTRLGQPDAGLKIVHVAGTKGKGSTSAMIAATLAAAGFRTGVFSSPHLDRIEERFAVDGIPCTADELVAMVARLRPVVQAMDEEAAAQGEPFGGPTYFECTTAIALLHFVEHQVDAAVLEVGLGGRLDSTNVCLPAVSVITSISFDHMQQLGHTLAAISREKAGIIKPGVPVVCGVTDSEPQSAIAEISREHGCRLLQLGRDFEYEYHPPDATDPTAMSAMDFRCTIGGEETELLSANLAMRGPHQAANAAVALATIAELRGQGWCISTDALRQGLREATLPGRVEVFGRNPLIVLDTAHNRASAIALASTIEELAPVGRRTLILSISRDKDVPAIVDELVPRFDRFIITRYQENDRAMETEALATIVRQAAADRVRPLPLEVKLIDSPDDAWKSVIETIGSQELICVAGSFFLATELRPLILNWNKR